MFYKYELASLTAKIFDCIYSITKPEYHVVEIFDNELQRLWSTIPADIRCPPDSEWATLSIQYAYFVLHYHLLGLIIHRPWAARGFRDARFYASALKAKSSARKILELVTNLMWLTSERLPLYDAHLGCIIVLGSVHALSMYLSSFIFDHQIHKDDIILFDLVLPTCESLASTMPVKVKAWLEILKSARGRLCYQMKTPNDDSTLRFHHASIQSDPDGPGSAAYMFGPHQDLDNTQ
ncbi:hypothetical protein BBP40_004098 [Aspergillus hancockii]|nr:hypothetical protein BBP40_004098 [Aspergillus hancockii]